jgi:hypothetical protein
VRSYWQIQIWNPCAGHDVLIAAGRMVIDETYVPTGEIVPDDVVSGRDDSTATWGRPRAYIQAGTGITVPFWKLALLTFAVAAVPWIRGRFSYVGACQVIRAFTCLPSGG